MPEADQYTFQVFDLAGKLYFKKTAQLDAGFYLKEFQLEQNLPKDAYLFKVVNSQTQNVKKFVVSD